MRDLTVNELWLQKRKRPIRRINQYTLEGVFVKTWKKQSLIQEELGFHPSAISRVCKGERWSAYGFLWRYAESVTESI